MTYEEWTEEFARKFPRNRVPAQWQYSAALEIVRITGEGSVDMVAIVIERHEPCQCYDCTELRRANAPLEERP